MSEFINNVTRRKETLKSILRQLHEGKAVDDVKAEFAALSDEISAEEIAEVEQLLIDEGMPVEEVHNLCDVHVAVMRDALDREESPETIPGHPIHTFTLENDAAELGTGGQELGQTRLATKLAVTLMEVNVVATLGGNRGRLQASGAAANHHDPAPPRDRGLGLELQFAARLRMLDA